MQLYLVDDNHVLTVYVHSLPTVYLMLIFVYEIYMQFCLNACHY